MVVARQVSSEEVSKEQHRCKYGELQRNELSRSNYFSVSPKQVFIIVTFMNMITHGIAFQTIRRNFQTTSCRSELSPIPILNQIRDPWLLQSTSREDITKDEFEDDTTDKPKQSWYKSPGDQWTKRQQFSDLKIRQKLIGVVAQELLEGRTGPKVFFECGVARMDEKGKWQIVNGMLRLGKKSMKPSVVKKKAARFRNRESGTEVYVSRIYPESGMFEVVTKVEDLDLLLESKEPIIPASSLMQKQEMVGTVISVHSYGVMVNVGANRNGLLHIQKVADLMGKYIDKKEGLEESGLERGAKIRVSIESNEKKRLFLDFTPDVKAEAAEDLNREKEENQRKEKEKRRKIEERAVAKAEVKAATEVANTDMSDEDAASWAEFAALPITPVSDDPYDDYNDNTSSYDEERDIEDALGLDSW